MKGKRLIVRRTTEAKSGVKPWLWILADDSGVVVMGDAHSESDARRMGRWEAERLGWELGDG